MENHALDLGSVLTIDPALLAHNREDYTVAQLTTALETTTTLIKLDVVGHHHTFEDGIYRPPPICIRRVVERICQCLANLRLQNQDHPLKEIQFFTVHPDIVREFLVALKQFGIPRVELIGHSQPFPIHFLTDFCHDNRNLKVLELRYTAFTDEGSVTPLPNDRSQDPIGDSVATTLNLDKLILEDVEFKTSTSATNFAHLLAHMSVSALELGVIFVKNAVDSVTKRIVSGFKMPSVEHLTLRASCTLEHVQAALDAGTATVTQLTFEIATEKLESLTRMIRGAVQLNSLTIITYEGNPLNRPPRQLFQALEACPTVTEIQVDSDYGDPHYFTEPEVQQLRRITARNSELTDNFWATFLPFQTPS